jgi:hypothetical protein
MFAKHLARNFEARLMLCGRSHEGVDTAVRLEGLRLGGEITYLATDVTNLADIRKLVETTRSRYGQINGVMHCAGILKDKLLAYADFDDFGDVVWPKIVGAHNLDILTKDDDLDFFLLCSSLVATTGNAGQCAYAFANGWLEGFARDRNAKRRRGTRSGVTTAVGWGPWRNGRMRLPPSREIRLKERLGLEPFEDASGLAALQHILAAAPPAVIAVAGEAGSLSSWIERDPGQA